MDHTICVLEHAQNPVLSCFTYVSDSFVCRLCQPCWLIQTFMSQWFYALLLHIDKKHTAVTIWIIFELSFDAAAIGKDDIACPF